MTKELRLIILFDFYMHFVLHDDFRSDLECPFSECPGDCDEYCAKHFDIKYFITSSSPFQIRLERYFCPCVKFGPDLAMTKLRDLLIKEGYIAEDNI